MDKNLIVEIFVPKHGSNGKQGEIATGYPIGRDLILTARHVLCKDYDENFPIEIRWRHPQVDKSQWWPIERVVWKSAEAFDVALLESRFPDKIEGRGYLSEQKPKDDMSWVSAGFARAGGKDEGERRIVHMKGEVFSANDTENQFDLGAYASVQGEENWRGASGSPVFVNWHIIGVVVSCPENFNATRLRATPLWRLLQDDPEFRQKSGYEDQKARRHRFEGTVADALEGSPSAMQALVDQLGGTVHGSDSERARDLASRLLELDIAQVIRKTKEARKTLGARDPVAVAALRRVMQRILPAVYDYGVIEEIHSCKTDLSLSLVSLPVSICTVAEIIMAGVDGRPTRFRHPDSENELPEGELSLPSPPEGGFDETGQAFKTAFDDYLCSKYCPDRMPAFRDALHGYMIDRFAVKVRPGRTRSDEDRIKSAANRLQSLAEDGETHYLLFDTPEADDDAQRLRALVDELKRQYSAVVFLSLDCDVELELSEERCYRPLCDVLYDDPEKRE